MKTKHHLSFLCGGDVFAVLNLCNTQLPLNFLSMSVPRVVV